MHRVPRIGALALASLLAGCGGSTKTQSPTPATPTTCPATVADAVGGSCSVAGPVCFPEYACGSAVAIATCRCVAGHFSCTDISGASIAAGANPSCSAASTAPPACPATAELATFSGCLQPGRICTYPSRCAGSIPAYETCQCVGAAQPNGTPYLRYECTDPCEFLPPGVPPRDAAPESAPPGDSGTRDASFDSPTPPKEAASGEASSDAKGEAASEAGTPDGAADAGADR